MNELRPCPFCGSNDVRLHKFHIKDMYGVTCGRCGTRYTNSKNESRSGVMAAWNRRTAEREGK